MKTPTVRSAWLTLFLIVPGALVAMLAGFGVYAAFGLCMESDPAACGDSPWREWWHLLVVWAIAVTAVVGPAVLAVFKGLAARTAGADAVPVIAISGAIAVLALAVLTLSIFV